MYWIIMWRNSFFSGLALRSYSFIITNFIKWNNYFFYCRKSLFKKKSQFCKI
ncbi:hypothetical protein Mapa_018137 [Marchantia paleacea]|nr:hypothetical protein Mapa_018137 [Marchantia paleacea]